MKEYIQKIQQKDNLTRAEIEDIMKAIMTGKAADQDISDLLLALNAKGPTVDELTGAAVIMREFSIPVKTKHKVVLDTCGTGGDGKDTFNISTVAAFVVAGAGVVVAKHGNRSVSSRCGSADVLEEMGVNLNFEQRHLGACLDEVGIAFLFAQKLHPAMKNVAAVRKKLGVKTIFNILGPLTNPARATHQMIGVYSRDLIEPVARVLKNLGSIRAIVVHGSDGLDEITTTGKTFVAELQSGNITCYDVDPAELGFEASCDADLRGGDVKQNIGIARRILEGRRGPQRDIVVLNAAYALYTAQRAQTISEGLQMAGEAIDSGSALKKLQQLEAFTNKHG